MNSPWSRWVPSGAPSGDRPSLDLLARLLLLSFAAVPACREAPEVTRNRTAEAMLIAQIAGLQDLVAKAESGQLVTQDRIAIGIAEETAKTLLEASLPQEYVVVKVVRVRIETAQPVFRGNNAALLFQATARGAVTGFKARLELGGRLADFRIENGKLTARVELMHLTVLDSSLGDVGSNVVETTIRPNLDALARQIPSVDIPVRLDQSIEVAGVQEDVVATKPGVLPVAMSVAEVLPVDRRLWILIDVKAGPWRPAGAVANGP